MGVGVGVQFGSQLGVAVGVFVGPVVGVGKPLALFVKMTSVTPLPISTITLPDSTSVFWARSGLTSILDTS